MLLGFIKCLNIDKDRNMSHPRRPAGHERVPNRRKSSNFNSGGLSASQPKQRKTEYINIYLRLLLSTNTNSTNTKPSVKVITNLLTRRLLLKVKSHLSPPHRAAEPTGPLIRTISTGTCDGAPAIIYTFLTNTPSLNLLQTTFPRGRCWSIQNITVITCV